MGEGKNYLDVIIAAATKMNGIINDLLYLSKISSQEITIKNVHLSTMIKSLLDDQQRRQPDRIAQITIADNVIARADERLIRLALTNLVLNAWKYTEKKEVSRIEFGVEQSKGESVYFIKDNGAGFDQNMLIVYLNHFSGYIRKKSSVVRELVWR